MDRQWGRVVVVVGVRGGHPGLQPSCAQYQCACVTSGNKEASLGVPVVFTALLFFHTARKMLPKHTFQSQQLNKETERRE